MLDEKAVIFIFFEEKRIEIVFITLVLSKGNPQLLLYKYHNINKLNNKKNKILTSSLF